MWRMVAGGFTVFVVGVRHLTFGEGDCDSRIQDALRGYQPEPIETMVE